MYRDAGNYKMFGSSVLTNNNAILLDRLELIIRQSLVDRSYFNSIKCVIPKLSFPESDEELDHDWYEFIKISLTKEPSDIHVDILEFIHFASSAHNKAFP